MGNGSGLGKPLTVIDIETAALAAVNNFGKPNMIYLGTPLTTDWHPEYSGTPWASLVGMTKREMAVAGLHTTLKKLGALKNIDEEAFLDIRYKSIKRLKRARWARYQQKKTK